MAPKHTNHTHQRHLQPSDDRGQATPLVAVLIVLIALASMAAAALGQSAIDQARARTAADAAALAAAVGGTDAGYRLAEANGSIGAIISVRDPATNDVHVQVHVGEAEAQARAIAPPRPGADGLAPAMAAAIARAEQLLGETIPIVSGFRSPEAQQALWDNRHSNPYPVAPPGTSMHELGLAIDVPSAFVPRLLSVAGTVGLCQPLPVSDPIHFVFCG